MKNTETPRTFYKQMVTVMVLSESHEAIFDAEDLVRLANSDFAMVHLENFKNTEVSAPEMASLVLSQDSDPEFFGLNEDGTDFCESYKD